MIHLNAVWSEEEDYTLTLWGEKEKDLAPTFAAGGNLGGWAGPRRERFCDILNRKSRDLQYEPLQFGLSSAAEDGPNTTDALASTTVDLYTIDCPFLVV